MQCRVVNPALLHTVPDRAGAFGHMGLLPLMKRLGLVVVVADAPATPRGKKRKASGDTLPSKSGRDFTPSTGSPPQLSAFREACKMAQPEWEKVSSADHLFAIGKGSRTSLTKSAGMRSHGGTAT